MPEIRCFLALPTSGEVQAIITSLIADLQSGASDVKWQDPKKLHLTLKFLGSIETGLVVRLTEKLSDRLRYHRTFDIVYEGLGMFPSSHHPTVLWIGVRESEPLRRLRDDVEVTAEEFGFERDRREFHPHLTIARIKGTRSHHGLTAKLKSLTLQPVSMRCEELLVMRSELHPDTSRYTLVQSIPLRP